MICTYEQTAKDTLNVLVDLTTAVSAGSKIYQDDPTPTNRDACDILVYNLELQIQKASTAAHRYRDHLVDGLCPRKECEA